MHYNILYIFLLYQLTRQYNTQILKNLQQDKMLEIFSSDKDIYFILLKDLKRLNRFPAEVKHGLIFPGGAIGIFR